MMSDETRALASAIEALARSNLDVIQEQQEGRRVNQKMATTLVQIYEQNAEILEQLKNAHSHARESDGKIRVLSERVALHSEKIARNEARLEAIETARRSSGAR